MSAFPDYFKTWHWKPDFAGISIIKKGAKKAPFFTYE
jgi:hypothetical protein